MFNNIVEVYDNFSKEEKHELLKWIKDKAGVLFKSSCKSIINPIAIPKRDYIQGEVYLKNFQVIGYAIYIDQINNNSFIICFWDNKIPCNQYWQEVNLEELKNTPKEKSLDQVLEETAKKLNEIMKDLEFSYEFELPDGRCIESPKPCTEDWEVSYNKDRSKCWVSEYVIGYEGPPKNTFKCCMLENSVNYDIKPWGDLVSCWFADMGPLLVEERAKLINIKTWRKKR